MREFNKINQRQSLSSAKLKDYFQRINNSIHISINKEIEKLEKGMSFLGSIGSVALLLACWELFGVSLMHFNQ